MLQELILSNATFSESHLNNIPVGLRRLNLANTKVTDTGFKAMGSRSLLEELNLSGTQISDATLEGIGRNPSWISLRIIDLSNTKVTDEGLKQLSKSLLLHPKAIVLTGTNVTPKGMEAIRSKWGKSCSITY